MLLVIHGCAALLFVILGILFFSGRGSALIAGYNTASPEEKSRYDEKALCRAMGGLMFALAACFVVMALSEVFQMIAFLWIGLVLALIVTFGGVIYMNTAKRVKRR